MECKSSFLLEFLISMKLDFIFARLGMVILEDLKINGDIVLCFGYHPRCNTVAELYLFCCRHAGEGIHRSISYFVAFRGMAIQLTAGQPVFVYLQGASGRWLLSVLTLNILFKDFFSFPC